MLLFKYVCKTNLNFFGVSRNAVIHSLSNEYNNNYDFARCEHGLNDWVITANDND